MGSYNALTSKTGYEESHSPGQTIRLSLRVKYAIFTALVVVIASIILVISAYVAVRKAVSEEIDEAGIRLVKVLSAIDFRYWNEIREKPLGEFIKQRGEEIIKHLQGKVKEDELNTVTSRLKEILAKEQDIFGQDPLSFIGSTVDGPRMGVDCSTILNILITDTAAVPRFVAGVHQTGVELEWPRLLRTTEGEIEIKEGGYVEPATGIRRRTRSYVKPIISSEKVRQGYVKLFLSAEKIDEALNRFLGIFILPALIAIAIGAIVGLWLANRVTEPIQTLAADMEIVSDGDFEHQTRVKTTDEIGILAQTFNQMTAHLRLAREKELAAKALEYELNIAAEIQTGLMPKKIPQVPGLDLAAYYRPCHDVGGDYFDVIELPEGYMGIAVADVSGKGVPGSMVMTMTRSLIRMEAVRTISPAQVLTKVNQVLVGDIKRGMFVTALYLVLNLNTKVCLVSSAGHNPLIIWRYATRTCGLVNPNGIALGFDKGPLFDKTIKEQAIQLKPGDRLVAYTDGVVETMDPARQEFGNQRFYQLVNQLGEKNSKEFIDLVIGVLDNYKQEAPQHDDITMVSLRVLN